MARRSYRKIKRPLPRPAVTIKRRAIGKRFVWPPELVRLLGRMPDRQLARRAGACKETVAAERQRRGIELFRPRRRRTEWTPEMIAHLGTDSDYKVARALDLSPTAVKRKRRLLGIPSHFPPPHDSVNGYPWTPQDLALLGKLTDKAVADQLGISFTAVARKRQELKIPATRPVVPWIRWTDGMLACLGAVSDSEVARRFGISLAAIKRKRDRLGIPGFVDRGTVVPTPALLHLLHHLPNQEVKRRTGLCQQTIRGLRLRLGIESPYPKRWSPEILARLGRETDVALAEEIGLSPSRVRLMRLSLGIAACVGAQRWRPEESALLGTAPDAVIARRLGRTEKSVRSKRNTLRIPASRK